MNAIYYDPAALAALISAAVAEGIRYHLETNSDDPDEIVDISKAAKILHLSVPTIRKYVKAEKLKRAFPGIRVMKFSRKELLRFAGSYR